MDIAQLVVTGAVLFFIGLFFRYVRNRVDNLATIADQLETSYLGEKGKNLATKEDIGEITRAVETVKGEFTTRHEELKAALSARNSLRLAAAEKRLDKHQEIYTRLWTMSRLFHDDDLGEILRQCQEWWVRNCLYLDRKSVRSCMDALGKVRAYHQAKVDSDAAFASLLLAMSAVQEGANLPALNDNDIEALSPISRS